METIANYYQKGLELAEAGRHKEALECVQLYLSNAPNDAQAINDAGAILHCLGRSDEAIEYFRKARKLAPDSAEVVWNLAEAYLAVGNAKHAVELFDDMNRKGILNADVLNRTANMLLEQGDKANALETLLRSLQISPSQEVLRPMVDVIRNKRPKVAFFCGLSGDVKFLTDIYTFLGERFPVKFFEGRDINRMHELMKWSDISWFEWCTDVAVEASKLPKVCKTIVRLHRFEAYADWPAKVQWENVDTLITVGNSFVKDALLRQVPALEARTRVITIPNGVNLQKFNFVERPRGKNLACIGYLNMRKNPMFLLQCMQKLHFIDPQYKLFFAGVFQDAALEQYVRYMVKALDLVGVVFFDGWQDDVNTWLQDKYYIVSTSIGEGHPMGLLEGMACGLKPVIHNFPGADQIFPSEFLFDISEEFCRQICSDCYEPRAYRRFVEERYLLERQLSSINQVFLRFEVETDAGKLPTASGNRLQSCNVR
ncbi:MAG: glycosyltransferase [Sedimentisphaerales bacterium]|nr:glycosyltransferase [Sedimentisphaerales bacterium]